MLPLILPFAKIKLIIKFSSNAPARKKKPSLYCGGVTPVLAFFAAIMSRMIPAIVGSVPKKNNRAIKLPPSPNLNAL